jgi:hypothetical protein
MDKLHNIYPGEILLEAFLLPMQISQINSVVHHALPERLWFPARLSCSEIAVTLYYLT